MLANLLCNDVNAALRNSIVVELSIATCMYVFMAILGSHLLPSVDAYLAVCGHRLIDPRTSELARVANKMLHT